VYPSAAHTLLTMCQENSRKQQRLDRIPYPESGKVHAHVPKQNQKLSYNNVWNRTRNNLNLC